MSIQTETATADAGVLVTRVVCDVCGTASHWLVAPDTTALDGHECTKEETS